VLLSCNSLSFTNSSMYASLSKAVETLASDIWTCSYSLTYIIFEAMVASLVLLIVIYLPVCVLLLIRPATQLDPFSWCRSTWIHELED
jgi:hypothetical protein